MVFEIKFQELVFTWVWSGLGRCRGSCQTECVDCSCWKPQTHPSRQLHSHHSQMGGWWSHRWGREEVSLAFPVLIPETCCYLVHKAARRQPGVVPRKRGVGDTILLAAASPLCVHILVLAYYHTTKSNISTKTTFKKISTYLGLWWCFKGRYDYGIHKMCYYIKSNSCFKTKLGK